MTLIEAILTIQMSIPFSKVVMIEYATENEYEFNYQLFGDKETRFINLTPKFVGGKNTKR